MFGNNFWLSKGITFILTASRVPLVETSRMNYQLTLKGHFKIWPKVKVMTWLEKIIMHISRSVSSAWACIYLRCLHRSSLPLSNVIGGKLLVTFHDLKWPWRHEGSLFAIFLFRVSTLFNFLPLTYNAEVAKLTRPWLTDIKILSKNWGSWKQKFPKISRFSSHY